MSVTPPSVRGMSCSIDLNCQLIWDKEGFLMVEGITQSVIFSRITNM